MEITHEPDAHRYVMRDGSTIVSVLDYAELGGVVSMTRTFTNPPYRKHGHAAELVAYAVDAVEREGRTIRPMCWFVAEWFVAHPDRAALLAA